VSTDRSNEGTRTMNGASTATRVRWKSAIGSLLAMALLGAACTSASSTSDSFPRSSASEPASEPPMSASEDTGELDGCMPACKDGNLIVPGDLPEGEYDTVWFFGGELRLTLDAGWTSREDSTGEFVVSPIYAPDVNDILFWEDVYPVEPPGGADTWHSFDKVEPIKGVPSTAAGLLDWMTSSPQLEVSKPTAGAIGDLPAMVVDVSVADDAVDDDPKNCPVRACVNFLGFPQWDGAWGIAGGPVRFYLSDVTYGGRDHLFVAAIYPVDPADMKTLGRAGERLISTVRVAADPA
jgi:hypothetical protein